MGSGIREIYGDSSPEKPRADSPELGEKFLIDRAHEVARSERAAGPFHGANHAFDELDVVEAPLPKQLLVLEQRLGEEEENVGPGTEIEILELHVARLEQLEKQLLQRRPRQRSPHGLVQLAVLL